MKKSKKIINKKFGVIIAFLLVLAVFSPLVIANNQSNKDFETNEISERKDNFKLTSAKNCNKNSAGIFIQKLVELFPVLGKINFINNLLRWLDNPDLCIPDICVNKTVKQSCSNIFKDKIIVDPGSKVTFKIEVENCGDTNLDIAIREDLPEGFTYVLDSAMLNGVPEEPEIINEYMYWYIPRVQPDELNTVTFHAMVTECGEYENWVNVSGCYLDGDDVYDEDNAIVIAPCEKPDIKVVKTATQTKIYVGESVTWNITVENTGDVTLKEVLVEDSNKGVLGSGITLLQDEKIYFEYDTSPVENTVNQVEASGKSSEGKIVTDRDTASIEVFMPCPPEVWIDDNWYSQSDVNKFNADLIWQYNAFNQIQNGIDVVCECGIVHVLEGEYFEQILIDRNLSLIGEPGAEIYAPDILDSFTIDSSSELYMPIIFAFAGTLDGNNVISNGNIAVTIEGFTIDGKYTENSIAILYHNVESGCTEALISNNLIVHIDIGIIIHGCTHDTTIVHNRIEWNKYDMDKIGILINESNECNPTGVEIHYNYIGISCGWNIGLWNQINTIVNATYNWWGSDGGPASPEGKDNYDVITGRIADGYGDRVIGQVHFDPWWGVDAYGTVSKHSADTGELIVFDASDSFAFDTTGDITNNINYRWKFGDGKYSFNKVVYNSYDTPGTYEVELMVEVTNYELDQVYDFLRDLTTFTITIN